MCRFWVLLKLVCANVIGSAMPTFSRIWLQNWHRTQCPVLLKSHAVLLLLAKVKVTICVSVANLQCIRAFGIRFGCVCVASWRGIIIVWEWLSRILMSFHVGCTYTKVNFSFTKTKPHNFACHNHCQTDELFIFFAISDGSIVYFRY